MTGNDTFKDLFKKACPHSF